MIKSVPTILFATMLFAPAALAQRSNPCDPRYHFLAPPDCTTVGQRVLTKVVEFRQHIAEESTRLAQARKRFFDTYPNKPGAAEARAEFWERLAAKDFHYLFLTVSFSDPKKRTALTDPSTANRAWDMIGGRLDNGIPQSATSEFFDWAFAVQQAAGGPPDITNAFTFPDRFFKAVEASEKQHQIYLLERDWAEFDAAGRDPAGLEDPAAYFPAICVRFQKVSWEDAFAEYDGIVKALGKDVVHRAVQQVHAAPKGRGGLLVVTEPDPVKRGPGGSLLPDDTVPEPDRVIGVTSGQIRAVERLATQGDDRRYLLWLLTDLTPRGSHWLIAQWPFAETMYGRYVSAFGEPAVLEAARKVRTAVKRFTDGKVMDPKAIGSTRITPYPAFHEVLVRKEPRGYVRSLLAFTQRLDSVAAVDAAYRTFLSGLAPTVSETAVLEAARKMAAGRPEPTSQADFDTLSGVLAGSVSLDKPVEQLFDFPKYVAWKGFPAGSKATYAHRALVPGRSPGNQLVPGQVSIRETYTLRSITEELALLYLTEKVFDPNGTPHPPRDTEIAYPAKAGRPTRAGLPETPLESGQETLEIKGRKIATRWQSVSSSYAGCPTVIKTWTSDEVPTALVRKTEEKTCGNRKFFQETILESFEGVRQPGVTNAMAAPPPPPPSAPAVTASAALPTSPMRSKGGPASAPAPPPALDASSAPVVNPTPAQPYPPDPAFPNYDLTEKAANKSIAFYCHQIYDPPFSLLSQEQVKFAFQHRAAIEADIRTCSSWFDVTQMMADRKVALRYCFVNNDFTPFGQARRKADYDACMNQNDVITALCTLEARARQELNSKQGYGGTAGVCAAPVPNSREALVVKQGGREDFGRPFVIPAAGPGLPAFLQRPLPPGFLRSGTPAPAAPPTIAAQPSSSAPAPVPATVPAPARIAAAPPLPPPSSARAAPSRDLQMRYSLIAGRANRARRQLLSVEQRIKRQGLELRPDIIDARSRLQSELNVALRAMRQGNTDQADESLRNAEAALIVIGKFLEP